MFNTNYVRGKMAESGYLTIGAGAKALGLPLATFSRKLRTGGFTFAEFEDLVITFNIDQIEKLSTKGGKYARR